MKNTKAQHIVRGAILSVVVGLIPSMSSAEERPLFLGASVWRAAWNVGLSDKQSENSRDGSVISNAISNAALRLVFTGANQYQTFFVNAPSNADLTNVGIFGTYAMSDVWSLTFNVAYGSTTFRGSRQIYFGDTSSAGTSNASFSVLDHDVTAERKDLDAVFARRITETPFAFFVGLKVQDWYYEAKPVNGVAPFNRSTTGSGTILTATGAGMTGFRYSYNSSTIGPSLGVMYTLAIDKEQALSFQAGLLYLYGNLTMIEKSDGANPAATLTSGSQTFVQPANSYLIRDEIKDKLQMPGFSFTTYYRRSLGSSVSLRIGLFYQETKAVSKAPKDTGYTYINTGESAIVLPATPRRLQPEFSVDGARDVFKGLAVSVVTKVW